MTSAYNRWCQHVFTSNLLQLGCLTVVESYIDIRLVFLKIGKGLDENLQERMTFMNTANCIDPSILHLNNGQLTEILLYCKKS